MNKPVVAHFVRKSTQFKASFIRNQIMNHIDYNPVGIYKIRSQKKDGGYAVFNPDNFDILNLGTHSTKYTNFIYKFQKLISNYDVKAINNFLTKRKVKILHFHYGTDAGIYYPFLKKNKIPSVVSFYGYDCTGFPKIFLGYGKHYLQKRVFPFVTKVLAMSPDMKKDLIKIGCPEEKILVHYYGTDVHRFYIKRNTKDKKKTLHFLMISGLVPKKGHLFLLKAFRDAFKKNKNIFLTIVGRGHLFYGLKDFIKENKMSGYVNLAGGVKYASDQHIQYLKNADVFIHPSVTDKNGDKEGIPGAIVEAMAAGLPVISTYHAGIPYIIKNNVTGILVNEWDIKSLSDAILKLSEDWVRRTTIALAGQEYALHHLDLVQKEKELENIYNQLLSEKC